MIPPSSPGLLRHVPLPLSSLLFLLPTLSLPPILSPSLALYSLLLYHHYHRYTIYTITRVVRHSIAGTAGLNSALQLKQQQQKQSSKLKGEGHVTAAPISPSSIFPSFSSLSVRRRPLPLVVVGAVSPSTPHPLRLPAPLAPNLDPTSRQQYTVDALYTIFINIYVYACESSIQTLLLSRAHSVALSLSQQLRF